MYHSAVDEVVPVAPVKAMVAAWCAAGSPVEFYEGDTGEHVGVDFSNVPTVLAYFTSRFGGLPTVTPPTTTTCNVEGSRFPPFASPPVRPHPLSTYMRITLRRDAVCEYRVAKKARHRLLGTFLRNKYVRHHKTFSFGGYPWDFQLFFSAQ